MGVKDVFVEGVGVVDCMDEGIGWWVIVGDVVIWVGFGDCFVEDDVWEYFDFVLFENLVLFVGVGD